MRKTSILLATCNGERHLREQLDSIAAQDNGAVDLWISDDGSTDGTLAILNEYRNRWTCGAYNIDQGPQRGFAENFRSLIIKTPDDADFFGFCDQDDVWLQDKLSHAMEIMDKRDENRPMLYCGRTILIDEQGRQVGLSRLIKRNPSFQNALLQNIAGGNTMLMNRAAFKIVQESARLTPFVSHDWWSYLIVSGAGGKIYYDSVPKLLYRQHSANAIGENRSWTAKISRLKSLFGGKFRLWRRSHAEAARSARSFLDGASQRTLENFLQSFEGNLIRRARYILKSNVYRQSYPETVLIYVLVSLGFV
ncbi:glycosyltransferase family 2 protein [Limoniibacter endophyticus]|uniref:glycosyltransferase family 2 protein n=1 Tax=Limoniibacter endophyticus TaxID=1565040 RepID=UPI00167B5AE3|nr:glycosyltransferase family 2 protein [Limoniibacter endophyticus]